MFVNSEPAKTYAVKKPALCIEESYCHETPASLSESVEKDFFFSYLRKTSCCWQIEEVNPTEKQAEREPSLGSSSALPCPRGPLVPRLQRGRGLRLGGGLGLMIGSHQSRTAAWAGKFFGLSPGLNPCPPFPASPRCFLSIRAPQEMATSRRHPVKPDQH